MNSIETNQLGQTPEQSARGRFAFIILLFVIYTGILIDNAKYEVSYRDKQQLIDRVLENLNEGQIINIIEQ